jgi:prophage antirepressor-like protein
MNNRTLELFEFNEQPVRVHLLDGEPWWVAADVCRAMTIRNVTEALRRLDGDDLSQTETIDALGRSQKVNVVCESGLYSLIIRSDKPQAKAFKRWLTKEVLPAIRRTGRYALSGRVDEREGPRTVGEALEALTRDTARARALVISGELDEASAQVISSLCAQELRAWELLSRLRPDRSLQSGIPAGEILSAAASGLAGDGGLGLVEIAEVARERNLCGAQESLNGLGRALVGVLGVSIEDGTGRRFRVFKRRTKIQRFYEFVFEKAPSVPGTIGGNGQGAV